jgi:hypothetical protein
MFTPAIRPNLVPIVAVSQLKTENLQDVFKYKIALRNDGSGSAERVFIIATGPIGHPDPRCWSCDASVPNGQPLIALRSIHPGEIYPMCEFKFIKGHHPQELQLRIFTQNQMPTFSYLKIEHPAMHNELKQFDLQVNPLR